jgi:hypothetical protein
MYSIELEYQRGLEWSVRALLRAGGTVRPVGHGNLEIMCVWALLKKSGTRNVDYFMTAGGN